MFAALFVICFIFTVVTKMLDLIKRRVLQVAEWSSEMMAENTDILRMDNVSKSFEKVEHDEVTHALNEVNLTMESGEFISLVGPSGCGKSTILSLVAGLIQPTTGYLTVGRRRLQGRLRRGE